VCWIAKIHLLRPAKTELYDCGLCVIALMALQGLPSIIHHVYGLQSSTPKKMQILRVCDLQILRAIFANSV